MVKKKHTQPRSSSFFILAREIISPSHSKNVLMTPARSQGFFLASLREPEPGMKPLHSLASWPLVGNEGMNPQYTNVKVDSLISY